MRQKLKTFNFFAVELESDKGGAIFPFGARSIAQVIDCTRRASGQERHKLGQSAKITTIAPTQHKCANMEITIMNEWK